MCTALSARHTLCLLLPADLPSPKCLPRGARPRIPREEHPELPGTNGHVTCAAGRGLRWAWSLLLGGNAFLQTGRIHTCGGAGNFFWFVAFIIQNRPHSLMERFL